MRLRVWGEMARWTGCVPVLRCRGAVLCGWLRICSCKCQLSEAVGDGGTGQLRGTHTIELRHAIKWWHATIEWRLWGGGCLLGA